VSFSRADRRRVKFAPKPVLNPQAAEERPTFFLRNRQYPAEVSVILKDVIAIPDDVSDQVLVFGYVGRKINRFPYG
jgi:hypothetical protein